MADPAELSLVPLDQPQGARQQLIGDRQAAGLPLGVPPGGGGSDTVPSPSGPPTGAPQDMLLAAQPTATPDIGQILNPAPPAQFARVRELRDVTPNAVARELLSRVLGE